jgi:hypothetical protein
VLLISAVGALVMLPFQRAALDPGLFASLALVMPDLASYGFGGRLLAALDLFTAWMLAVAAVGVAVVNRRSPALPLAVLLGSYVLVLAIIAGAAG